MVAVGMGVFVDMGARVGVKDGIGVRVGGGGMVGAVSWPGPQPVIETTRNTIRHAVNLASLRLFAAISFPRGDGRTRLLLRRGPTL